MTPEFSRIVRIDRIPDSGLVREIDARDAECSALARRFSIVAIEALAARVALRPAGGGDIGLTARIRARVVQECVATLEPVEGAIDEEVSLLFRPVADETPGQRTVVIPSDENFEPFAGDALDIGEIVAVELALSLDPFPRAPGADIAPGAGDAGDASSETAESPFRALAERSENG